MNEAKLPSRGIVRIKQLQPEYGISPAQSYRLEKTDPTFPKKRQLSQGSTGYLRRELDEWTENLPVANSQ